MTGKLSRLIAAATEALLPERTVSRMRELREWKAWIASLEGDLLVDRSDAAPDAKQALFARHVKLVEIETHARCNRICSFCPNSIVDRRRNRAIADAEMLRRVFSELGSIEYARQIKVARYSEPLANPHLYERLEDARRLVPRAQLAIVTNSDYLTRVALARLRAVGLNVLYISLYLKASERWSLELARRYSRALAAKLGVRPIREQVSPFSLVSFYQHEGMVLRSACMNFEEYGTDRGATMVQYAGRSRTGPCREPFETFVIDYTGDVMPCCNLRHDIPEHVACRVGELSASSASIFDLYASALSAWRRSMVGVGPKAQPCSTCRHREPSDDVLPAVRKLLRNRLATLKADELYAPSSL